MQSRKRGRSPHTRGEAKNAQTINNITATNVTINNVTNVYNETVVESKNCTKCKEVKLIQNFSLRSKSKDGHAYVCKSCHNKRGFTYKRRPEVIIREKRLQKIYCENKSAALKIIRIASKMCETCGVTDPNVLTLDHLDPAKKKRKKNGLKIGAIGRLSNSEQIIAEFLCDNTRVLCSRCHHKHTITQRGNNIRPVEKKKRMYIVAKKKEIGKCAHCDFDDMSSTAAFHFDHLDPETKSYGISEMVRLVKTEDFKRLVDIEIAKCQLLCANCHFVITRKQRNAHMTPEMIETIKKDVLDGKYDHLSTRMYEIKNMLQ